MYRLVEYVCVGSLGLLFLVILINMALEALGIDRYPWTRVPSPFTTDVPAPCKHDWDVGTLHRLSIRTCQLCGRQEWRTAGDEEWLVSRHEWPDTYGH